jgi:RecA-family ATPase
LFDATVAALDEFGSDLVIVDALADVFAGDENSRTLAASSSGC